MALEPIDFRELSAGDWYRPTNNPKSRAVCVKSIDRFAGHLVIHQTNGQERRVESWSSRKAWIGHPDRPTPSTKPKAPQAERRAVHEQKLAEWKADVLARDNHICRRCKQARAVTAHHVVKQGDIRAHHEAQWLYDPINGVALCAACHANVHALHDSAKPTIWICKGVAAARQFMADGGHATLP